MPKAIQDTPNVEIQPVFPQKDIGDVSQYFVGYINEVISSYKIECNGQELKASEYLDLSTNLQKVKKYYPALFLDSYSDWLSIKESKGYVHYYYIDSEKVCLPKFKHFVNYITKELNNAI